MSGRYYPPPRKVMNDWEALLDSEFLSTAPFLKDTIAQNGDLGEYLISHAVLQDGPGRRAMARLDSRAFYEHARTIYRMELERTIVGYRPPYPPDNQKVRQRASQFPHERFQNLLADIISEHARRRLEKISLHQVQVQAPTLEVIAEGRHVDSSSLVPYIKSLMTLACKEQLRWNHDRSDGFSLSGMFLLYQLILSVTSQDPPPNQAGLFKYLIGLKGREACAVLNALQLILDFSVHICDESNRVAILKALHRLASNSEMYPSVLGHPKVDLSSVKDPPIGAGSFGQVYKVNAFGELLALKVAREGLPKKTFCKEVVTWSNLSHENVLPFYGVFSDQGRFTLVSPFVVNGNINDYLWSRYPRVRGPRIGLIADIASGLKYLHSQGVIHGDLKGDNILVSENERACLADLGISTITTDAHRHLRLTRPSTARAGTYAYQAPEIFECAEPTGTPDGQPSRGGTDYNESDSASRLALSKKSDIYALACVCYEIMTMESPFHHIAECQIAAAVRKGWRPKKPAVADLAFTNLGLTEEFWALIEHCWHQEPDERPTTEYLLHHHLIAPYRVASSSYNSGEWDAAQARQNKIMVGLGLRPLNHPSWYESTSMYTTERT